MGVFYLEPDEIFQIIISVLAVSLALAIADVGLDLIKNPFESMFFISILIVTVGSGFVFHELSHKVFAIYYGAYARFRMWTQGLFMMLVLSFLGVLFAAPGAVYIYSKNITKRQNGIISVAGPLTNIALIIAFLILGVFLPITFRPKAFDSYFLSFVNSNIWFLGAWINVLLAIFNLLPIFPLDGSKVFSWNILVWLLTVAIVLGIGSIILPFDYIFLLIIFMSVVALIARFLIFRKG